MKPNNDLIKINKNILDFYIKKWREILYSTHPVNQQKATEAIQRAYSILDLPKPQIIFVSSPLEAESFFAKIKPSVSNYHPLKFNLSKLLEDDLFKNFTQKVYSYNPNIDEIFYREKELFENVCSILYNDLIYNNLSGYIDHFFDRIIDSELLNTNCCEYDLYIKELNYNGDKTVWNILKSLAQECPYILSFSKDCLVIERPPQLHFDNQNLIHAEGKPAIEFVDGYNLYAYHGIRIPEKYGKYPLSQWQPQWLLEISIYDEELAEALIRGIGYDNFHQKLPNSDSYFWQHYELLMSTSMLRIYNWLIVNYSKYFSNKFPGLDIEEIKELTKSLPLKLPKEIYEVYYWFKGKAEIAPTLYLYPLEQIITEFHQMNWMKGEKVASNKYAIPLFHGVIKDFYYVLCDQEEKEFSEIWYVSPGINPEQYATNLTSLILTIAECYEIGAYYVVSNEKTEQLYLEQNLDKVEKIFQKYNPEYIDTWRRIWKK